MKHPHVPRTWTGRQALVIAERLDALADAIFDVYWSEVQMELLLRELEQDGVEPALRPAPAPPPDLTPF